MDARHNCRGEPVRKDGSGRTGSLCARRTLVVGLTGGAATGKTTVARMFKALGAKVLSADEIVHKMLRPGADMWQAVVREFGEGILAEGGKLDRRKLAETVFHDPRKRLRLEAITHPPVLDHLSAEAERFRDTGEGVLILEIPLLVETSSLGLVDKVLVVTAEQETQIRRLQKRYSIGREEAMLRIKSQLPMSEKLRHADWVVSTEGELCSTRKQVERVWSTIQKSLAQPQ